MAEQIVSGTAEIIKALKSIDNELLTKRVITSAARSAAKPLVSVAKKNAPVSKVTRTEWWGSKRTIKPGQLQKSIGVSALKREPGVKVGPRSGRKAKHDGWFAHFVEYGTAGYTVKKGKNKGRFVPGQSAQPFMRPAYEQTQTEIFTKFRDDMVRAFDKITAKMKK